MATSSHRGDSDSRLIESLDRTVRLMRDEVGNLPADSVLLDALVSTRVGIVADASNISNPVAQSALVTAVILMARSGHSVFVRAPNVEISGVQPPLRAGRLIDQLFELGADLLPGRRVQELRSDQDLDLLIALGSSPTQNECSLKFRINASAWSGSLLPFSESEGWSEFDWPMGAMAAGALAAGEAFKVAMRKLEQYFIYPPRTEAVFAPIRKFVFELAPPGTPVSGSRLGAIDLISGGAITNSTLYALLRIPGLSCSGRIIEPQTADLTNLNRYAVLRRSEVEKEKATLLSIAANEAGVDLLPVPLRFDNQSVPRLEPLAPTVVVGADDIPTRWLAQKGKPKTLVIGATTHWSAMASVHTHGTGCARCLHRSDDPVDVVIPTTACVSFWSGLFVASYLLRCATGPMSEDGQIFLTPFRPEYPTIAAVGVWADCPDCGGHGVS